MKRNPEDQKTLNWLVYLESSIDENNEKGLALSQELLKELKVNLMKLMEDDDLVKFDESTLSSDVFDLSSEMKEYSDVLLYAIKRKSEELNPLADHSLMMKKVSDMTGYEYERYLQLVNKRSKILS